MDLAYLWYETAHWMLSPARAATDATRLLFENPVNPLSRTPYGRTVAAACELFERTTRRYDKPTFGLDTTVVDGKPAAVTERVVWERPFCRVIAFDRAIVGEARAAAEAPDRRPDVGALRHAPARHGRGLPADPPGVHHRLGGRPHGAARGRVVRSRRLHRLRDVDGPVARAEPARARRVPALRAR